MKNTEPIAVTTHNWPAGHPHLGRSGSGEYLGFWYVGQIAEDAVSGYSPSILSRPPPSPSHTLSHTLLYTCDATDHEGCSFFDRRNAVLICVDCG